MNDVVADTQNDSVTRLIVQLKAGQESSADRIWERYYRRLVGLARGRLPANCRQAADEEDVALSAFASFFRGVEGGRFPRLDDRDDLWRVLLTIVSRKSNDLLKCVHRDKRDVGRLLADGNVNEAMLDAVVAEELTPDVIAQVTEECTRLLGMLNSVDMKKVAILKMEGYSNQEIAERMDCAPRTIDRRLLAIREIWNSRMSLS